MNKKTFLLALALTCTLLLSVGCGRRMNSATDGTDQNTTVEENNTNSAPNDNVVDGLVNGVEDTVDGVVNGVDDVVDGIDNTGDDLVDDTDHTVNEPVTDPATGTGTAANPLS